MRTFVPFGALVPAAGSWATTVPTGWLELTCAVVTAKPALTSWSRASACCRPTAFGTVTVTAPEDAVRCTVEPLPALLFAAGSWLNTTPTGWLFGWRAICVLKPSCLHAIDGVVDLEPDDVRHGLVVRTRRVPDDQSDEDDHADHGDQDPGQQLAEARLLLLDPIGLVHDRAVGEHARALLLVHGAHLVGITQGRHRTRRLDLGLVRPLNDRVVVVIHQSDLRVAGGSPGRGSHPRACRPRPELASESRSVVGRSSIAACGSTTVGASGRTAGWTAVTGSARVRARAGCTACTPRSVRSWSSAQAARGCRCAARSARTPAAAPIRTRTRAARPPSARSRRPAGGRGARSASQTGLFAWTATSAAVSERPRQEREDQQRHVHAQTRRPATAALVEHAEREARRRPHERDQPEPAAARPDVGDEVQDRRGRSQPDERRECSDHG